MQTVLTRSPRIAARYILTGDVVAFPTETVYGLGANVFDEKAVRKIFKAKRRPADNPLIAHIADTAQLPLLVSKVTPTAKKFIRRFFPGPLTIILPKHKRVPRIATAGLRTIGVRMPDDILARSFLKHCGVPVVAPSANLSGTPSPTSWQTVVADMKGRVRCILKGGQTKVGLESTVVDCTGSVPVVLRSGAVTLEQLRKIVPSTRMFDGKVGAKPKSPGMKHRHYSPRARVVIVASSNEIRGSKKSAYIGLDNLGRSKNLRLRRICSTTKEYAHLLFAFFRTCDAAGISTIYCQSVEIKGLGRALMDRLKRASR